MRNGASSMNGEAALQVVKRMKQHFDNELRSTSEGRYAQYR